jgi:DNA (cytosine-5)-methyltransferase 1
MSELSVVDFFSGCGGTGWGFASHSAFKLIGAVDKQVAKPSGSSTKCNPTYSRNLGIEPKPYDLATLKPKEYMAELELHQGELDVLISCAPCTGFSQKNAQNHVVDDKRNQLVRRTGLFVEVMRPRFLVMENVKELLDGNFASHFRSLRKQLSQLGYSTWAEVHDLSEYGLPQRRIRSLVIASRDGVASGPPLARTTRTVRDAIGHLPAVAAGETHPDDPMHRSPSMGKQVFDRIRAMPKDGGSWGDIMTDPHIPEERRRYLCTPAMFRARAGSFPDVYGRMAWDRPAPTIVRECGHVGNGRYAHPEQDRMLTVREMALLQGFPPDYEFVGPLIAKYNQLGDAVPPLISAQIAAHIATLAAL